jgi:hypothetical protein
MSYADDVVAFLLEDPENLRLAFEVSDHIEEAKTELEKRFWKTVHRFLQERLEGAGLASGAKVWTIFICDPPRSPTEWKEQDWEGFEDKFFGLSIVPDWLPSPYQYPHVCIEREANLYMGVRVPGPPVGGKYTGKYTEWEPLLIKLRSTLEQKYYKSEEDWWLGWKNIDEGTRLRDRAVLMEIARGDAYAERMAQSVWDLFESRRVELEGIIERITAATRKI